MSSGAGATRPFVPEGIWEWYPHSITRDNPPKQPVIKGADGEKIKHGTFDTYPYYAFIQTGAPGQERLLLVSDNGLRAELRLIDGSVVHREVTNKEGVTRPVDGAKFRLLIEGEDEFEDATLSYNLEDCDDEAGIIVVTGLPRDYTPLPPGFHGAGKHYVPSEPREADDSGSDFALGSVFVHKIYAFGLFRRAWDVRYMDLIDQNFQITGTQTRLFAEPSGSSKNYFQVGGNLNVPYGWVYESYAGGEQHESSSMLASSADVANAVQQATGFKASGSVGFDLGVVSAEASFSVATNGELKTRIGQVKSQERSFIEKTVIRTEAAFVLDKRNVALSESFKRKVVELRRQLVRDSGTLKEEVLESFFEQFGTHYAYAGITGAKGRLVTSIDAHTLLDSVAKGDSAKTKWQANAKFSLVGVANVEAGGGTEASGATEHERKTQSIFKSNDTYTVTYGGTSSDGGQPGAGNSVPVLLDLRPISDLFGVPFYTDYTTAVRLHDQIAAAVARFAFTPERNIKGAGLGFRKLTFEPIKIEIEEPGHEGNPQYFETFEDFIELINAGDQPRLMRILALYGVERLRGMFPIDLLPEGRYRDTDQLGKPASWGIRAVLPRNTFLPQAGGVARQPTGVDAKVTPPCPQFRKGLNQIVRVFSDSRSERVSGPNIEICSLGGTSVLLGPDTVDPSQLRLWVDVVLDETIGPFEVVEYDTARPGMYASDATWNLAQLVLDVRGPANGGPGRAGPFAVRLLDLKYVQLPSQEWEFAFPAGAEQQLKYAITVMISATIEQVTARDLLWLSR